MASYNLEDGAQLWYIQFQRDEGTLTWRRFTEVLNTRFGPPLRSNPLGELVNCHRTTTVDDFQGRFEALLPRAGTLSECQKVWLFTNGLRPPLSMDVEIHNPQTLAVAMSLARKIELRDQCAAQLAAPQNQRGLLPTPRLALPAPPTTSMPRAPPSAVVEGRPVKRLSQSEMEERRRLGLCFNCNDKFERGHNRVCKRIFLLDLAEDDDDATALPPAADEPSISLLAISGVRTADTMQVQVRLGNAVLVALIDTGLTHNFLADSMADSTGLPLVCTAKVHVRVANGDKVSCPGAYRAARFSIANEVFIDDFFALPLAGYDVVLGTRWLKTLGQIGWNFNAMTMTFWRADHLVHWQGVNVAESQALRVCSTDDLLMVLLEEFADVFREPTGLPPVRSRDHRITLAPGSSPVAVRPYR